MAQDAQHPPHNRPHPADERITRRLRLFFGLITCLIIPTVLALLALLIWYLVAVRQAEDLECDQPLKAYAYCALVIFVYSLHHRTIKKLLFSYDRDRDGPRRPSTVQLYDRIYQLVSLCYAITGICWVADSDTCQDTAPDLYAAGRAFVYVQCGLMCLMLLPLMCAPCIFIWLMRQGFLFGEGADGRYGGAFGANQGVEQAVLDTWPIIEFDKVRFNDDEFPEECCICMAEFECVDKENPILQTKCKHVFHKECLGGWLKNHRVCPLCRLDLGVKEPPSEASPEAGDIASGLIQTVEMGEETAGDFGAVVDAMEAMGGEVAATIEAELEETGHPTRHSIPMVTASGAALGAAVGAVVSPRGEEAV